MPRSLVLLWAEVWVTNQMLSQVWQGSGTHGQFITDDRQGHQTSIIESKDQTTKTSTFVHDSDICFPDVPFSRAPTLVSNQTYTMKIGNVTRSTTLPDTSYSWSVYPTKIGIPSLSYSVSHMGPIDVPYSFSYSATLKIDQSSQSGETNYATFNVSLSYSGYIHSKGFSSFYGSVNGESKMIASLYGSVNGESKKIKKLYGSVNGKSKKIFEDGVWSIYEW